MNSEKIFDLSEIAQQAQVKIQQQFQDIDPVVGIMQGLRASGFPADAMTIDCRASGKRIIIILHDERPDQVDYQWGFIDQDPARDFLHIPYNQVTVGQMYAWMKGYFSPSA